MNKHPIKTEETIIKKLYEAILSYTKDIPFVPRKDEVVEIIGNHHSKITTN